MTIHTAREILARHTTAPYGDVVLAAAVLTDSKEAELGELIRCLHVGGLAAEQAAIALYLRTGRARPASPAALILDADDWRNYLSGQIEHAIAS